MPLLTSLHGNSQKLDGGAMFGNAPRVIWERWCTPDAEGRIELACRCFLLQEEGENILIEAGVGAFFSPNLAARYGVVEKEHQLLNSLAALNIKPEQIDRIYLSHLHFDHAGGILSSFDEGPLHLVFKRAQYFVGEVAWERALTPHRRDRASYIPELNRLLKTSGQLNLIPASVGNSELRERGLLTPSMGLSRSDGHSPGMSLFTFTGQRGRAAFCADLIPGLPWFRAAITMGYDRFPEQLIDEKLRFLEELGPGAVLLFTHDPKVAAVQLIAPAGAEDSLLQAGIQVNDFQVWNLDHCEVPRFSSAI